MFSSSFLEGRGLPLGSVQVLHMLDRCKLCAVVISGSFISAQDWAVVNLIAAAYG